MLLRCIFAFFFFFQAEDGIRDLIVTGVQTCALPISVSSRPISQIGKLYLSAGVAELRPEDDGVSLFQRADEALYQAKDGGKGRVVAEIGRASCRERV